MESGGVEALFDQNRRKPNLKNRIDEATSDRVRAYAVEQPAHGQVRASNELCKLGVFVSPSGVRSIWLRYDLGCFKQRLAALEKHVAATGAVLTEAQVVVLEKKAEDDGAWRIRDSTPVLARQPGYFLRWHPQGRRPDLPTDLRRYLLDVGRRQALHFQEADYGGGLAQ